jgi:diacylglycerol kinase (ATP)
VLQPATSERVALIANPAAGRGRAGTLLPSVREAFAAVGARDVFLTTQPGDEARLAREAVALGCTTVVAVGGDGTWSRVAGALVDLGADVRFVPVAAGTGNDLAKSLGLPSHDAGAMARLAVGRGERRIDVGRIDTRCFLNAAGIGFDAAVIEATLDVRWLRGDALYLYAALRELLGYREFVAEVSLDGDAPEPRRLLALVFANGHTFGGRFRVAPESVLDDGELDVVSIAPAGAWRRLRLFAAATRGDHVRMPEIGLRRANAVRISFEEPPLYEADGELYRASSAEVRVECLPSALRVVMSG